MVAIPRGNVEEVSISEHFDWDDAAGSTPMTLGERVEGQIRVILARPKWDAIAHEVRAEFNQRLKKMGRSAGAWRAGPNLVRRELGKELVMLAWAVEDADPRLIPDALANWKGLYPEERWWLYTQTAAATGHGVNDRGRGWRRALRYALTENPVSRRAANETTVPEFFKTAAHAPLFAAEAQADDEKGEPQQ